MRSAVNLFSECTFLSCVISFWDFNDVLIFQMVVLFIFTLSNIFLRSPLLRNVCFVLDRQYEFRLNM